MTEQPATTLSDGHLSRESVHTILRAARVALRAYPGPIGELIDRELRAYGDTGQQLPPRALPERLLTALRTLENGQSADPERTLPARYRPGTPLHWELTPGRTDSA